MGDRLATIDKGRKVVVLSPFQSPSNTLWPTSVPSGILIYPTVWPQYTNVTDSQTDRQDRQRSDSIGRTVLQTVAQKRTKRI